MVLKYGESRGVKVNRSHAACYAYVAIITAYMACHWTSEFYAAMLNAFIENNDKQKAYLSQAVKRGIKILPPDINESATGFIATSADSIRFGFKGITGVGKVASGIVEERNANGLFSSPQDFYERMGKAGKTPSTSFMTALISSGSFDFYSPNKNALIAQIEKIASNFAFEKKHVMDGQFTLFDDDPLVIEIPNNIKTSQRQSLEMEHKFTGFYITAHPADTIYPLLNFDSRLVKIEDLENRDDKMSIVVGIISGDPDRRYTKKGDLMYRFVLEDQYHSVRCTVFPKRVASNEARIVKGALVEVIGRYDVNEEYGNQFIVQDILSESEILKNRNAGICVTVQNKDEQQRLLNYAKLHPGNSEVVIKAKGKLYHNKVHPMELGQSELDYLQSHFSSVDSL